MAFCESEMTPRGVIYGDRGRVDLPLHSAPITAKENMRKALHEGKVLFMPNSRHNINFNPRVLPDIEARGMALDGGEPLTHPEGFKDMFGITWKFIAKARGAMVEPGTPLLDDMNDWEEKVVWPDIESWDWEKQKEISKEFINDPEVAYVPMIVNGYFERLISLMDFEGAAMAMIDEDQQDAIHAFFDKLADLYIRIIDKMVEVFPCIDGFCVHDDWGSQRAPFFSLNTAMEMLVPHMKKVCDHIHAKGLFYDMHSCGQIEALVPAMIAIGVDSWNGQDMNDKAMLFEKYGNQIVLGIEPEAIPADMPEETIAAIAKAYVDKYFAADKFAMLSYRAPVNNAKFYDYVYRYSRMKIEEQN